MTDQRPQYGELATPEEQRRAAGLPPLGEAAPVVAPPPPASAPEPVDAAPAKRPHPVDRIVTIAMLAYGLVNVVITGLSYLDLPRIMNESMRILGIDGEFTNFAQGKTWGTIAAALLVLGWAITAALSFRRLRRGRITWWLPVVGAVITVAVVSSCLAVPMFNDPAFAAYLDQMGAG